MRYTLVMKHVCFCAAAAFVAACNRDAGFPVGPARQAPPHHVAAVALITFRNIGLPTMTSSAIIGTSVRDVEARLAALERTGQKGGPRFDLTVPENSNGTGDATIQLRFQNADASTVNGTRYFEATYLARNAQKTDSVAFDTPRHNLTWIAVSDARTLDGTAVLVFNKADGTQANPALALQLEPTGLIAPGGGATITPTSADVMQIFTEPEIAAIAEPPDVTNAFPYGFVTRHQNVTTDRTLAASPDTNQFDGIVTFAFRLPTQALSTDDPTTITLLMLALDDNVVKVTQSLEEQTAPGPANVAAAAAALGATQVRLLAGGAVTTSIPTQTFCAVRTAGPAGAATANLTNPNFARIDSTNPLTPSPYAAAGQRVALTSTIQAHFLSAATGPTFNNFVVRGSISGHQFRTGAYTGSGTTTITTPAGAFKTSEDLEVTITAGLGCPAWVGRLKVGVFTASATPTLTPTSVNLTGPAVNNVAVSARAATAGDFDGDGHLDAAFRTTGGNGFNVDQGDKGAWKNLQAGLPVTTNTFTGTIVAADFNNDGKLDVAIVNGNDVVVGLNTSTGSGHFSFSAGAGFPSVGDSPTDLALGDFNADGLPDLVITFADHLAILLGDGAGGFKPPINVPTGAGTRAVVVGDLNQDGKLDLVVANNNGSAGTLTVWLGNGDGTFRLGPSVANAIPISGLAIGDLNNDGHVDVATADSTARSVTVRLGNGDGTLGAPLTAAVNVPTVTTNDNGSVSAVVMGDETGDGNLDLIIVNGGQHITVLNGNGTGNFAGVPQETSTAALQQMHIAMADWDETGSLDLIMSEGLGTTTFNYVKK